MSRLRVAWRVLRGKAVMYRCIVGTVTILLDGPPMSIVECTFTGNPGMQFK